MRHNLYTYIWEQCVRKRILDALSSNDSNEWKKEWSLPSDLFVKSGDRKVSGYAVSVTLVNGKCLQKLRGSAVARDLRDVIVKTAQSSQYCNLFKGKRIKMTMNESFVFCIKCENSDTTSCTSFPPIVDEQSEILILGTMPGDKSLKTREYYADNRNIFWKVISNIYNDGKDFSTYEDKIELVKRNHIAIWDVFLHCQRDGSTDKAIKESGKVKNNIDVFLSQHPNIKRIVFNGKNALSEYKPSISFKVALSTSPSNQRRYSDEERIESWRQALKL